MLHRQSIILRQTNSSSSMSNFRALWTREQDFQWKKGPIPLQGLRMERPLYCSRDMTYPPSIKPNSDGCHRGHNCTIYFTLIMFLQNSKSNPFHHFSTIHMSSPYPHPLIRVPSQFNIRPLFFSPKRGSRKSRDFLRKETTQ